MFAKNALWRKEKVCSNMKSLMSLSKGWKRIFCCKFGCFPISKLTRKQLNVPTLRFSFEFSWSWLKASSRTTRGNRANICEFKLADSSGVWGLEETLWKVENTHAHIYMYTLHTKNVCFGFWTLSSAVPTFQCKTQVDNFNNWRIRNTVQLQTFVFWSLTISYKYLLRSAAGIKMAPQAYTRNVDRI